jgi:DNA polymerase-4
LPENLFEREDIAEVARELLAEVQQEIIDEKVTPQTLTLKIKYADFTLRSKQRTTEPGTDWEKVLEELLNAFDYTAGVRLVGVGFSNFLESMVGGYEQLTLPLEEG